MSRTARTRAVAELTSSAEQLAKLERQLARLQATVDRRLVRAIDAGVTQEEAGKLLGVSRVRISQRVSAARAAVAAEAARASIAGAEALLERIEAEHGAEAGADVIADVVAEVAE